MLFASLLRPLQPRPRRTWAGRARRPGPDLTRWRVPRLEGLEGRLAPATVSWVGSPFGGPWGDADNWVDDQGAHRVPGPNDDVIISGLLGIGQGVTHDSGMDTVRSLQIPPRKPTACSFRPARR
jgi:hypothetical protein